MKPTRSKSRQEPNWTTVAEQGMRERKALTASVGKVRNGMVFIESRLGTMADGMRARRA